MSADVPPDPADRPAPLPRPDDHPLRPTPEQWGFVAHQLGELTPDTIGVVRP